MAQLQTTAVTGSLTVTGQIVAQTLNVQQVTSSIIYSSGSNRFGNLTSDVQQFTGSLRVTGSGAHYIVGGNVGIGTVSPGVPFHIVNGAVTPTGGYSVIDLAIEGTSEAALGIIGTTYSSIYFGDAATALAGAIVYNHSNDALDFRTNGNVERMRITSAGSVGIGTSSPVQILDVSGSIRVVSTGTYSDPSDNAGLINYDNASGVFTISARSSGGSTYLALRTSNAGTGAERVRITNDGNLGIGTTSPIGKLQIAGTSGNLLTVGTLTNNWAGEVAIGVTNGNGVIISKVNTSNDTNRVIVFSRDDTNGATIWGYKPGGTSTDVGYLFRANASSYFNGGSVGIGTTTPNNLLTVNAGNLGLISNAYGSTGLIRMYGTDGNEKYQQGLTTGGDFYQYTFGGINHIFYTNTAESMRISTAGYLGIGTTSPSYKLDVYGTSPSTRVSVRGTTNYVLLQPENDSGTFYLGIDNNSGGGFSNTAYARTLYATGLYPMIFYTNSAERLRIAATGNIGIGTTSPAARLQVSGSSDVLNVKGSGSLATSSLFSVDGAYGRLFEVSDDLTNSLFSVNTIAGLPVIEAFADYSVNLGTYSAASGSTMRVTGSRVGIGTTTPGTTLDVIGNIRAQSFTGSFSGSSAAPGATNNVIYNSSGVLAGSNSFVFDGTNIGIGTTSPTRRLQIGNLTSTSTATPEILSLGGTFSNSAGSNVKLRVYDDSGTSIGGMSVSSGQMEVNTWSSGKIAFYRGTTQSMIIDANGNLGIGTTAPGALLQVGHSVNATSETIRLGVNYGVSNSQRGVITWHDSSGITGKIWTIYDGSSMTKMNFGGLYNSAYDQGTYLTIQGNGNIGIGTTSPAEKFHIDAGSAAPARLVSSGFSGIEYHNVNGTWKVYVGTETGGGGARYNSADSQHTFYNNGTAVVRINSGGNLGIGTTNPTRKLDIQGTNVLSALVSFNETSTTADRYSQLEFVAGSRTAYIWLANENSTSWAGAGGLNIYTTNGNMDFWTSTTQKMRITTTGDVGIGTTTPYAGTNVRALDINATAYPTLALSVNGTFVGGVLGFSDRISLYAQTSKFLVLETNGSEKMRIDVSGNVGIGTTNPLYKLDVNGTFRSNALWTDGSAVSYWGNGSVPTAYGGLTWGTGYATIFSTSGNVLYFGAGGASTKMVLDTNGNLGIGATAPLARLHVGPNVSDTSTYAFTNTAAVLASLTVDQTAARTNVLSLMRDGTSGVVYAGLAAFDMSRWSADSVNARTQLDIRLANTDTGTLTDVLSLRSNGNVGIGITASAATLHVSGTTGGVFEVDGRFGVNSLYVSASGNVGIGTTSPLYKLDLSTSDTYITLANFISTNNNRAIKLQADPSGTGIGDGDNFAGQSLYFYTADKSIQLATNSITRIYISGSGNVGIATTSPTLATLQVQGNIWALSITGSLQGTASYATQALSASYAPGGGGSQWTTNGTSIYYNTGNVGINSTTPAYRLDVSGSLRADSVIMGTDITYGAPYKTVAFGNTGDGNNRILAATTTGDGMYFMASTGNGFKFRPNGGTSDLVTITSAGNLGIGTTAPGRKLQVVGSATIGEISNSSTNIALDLTAGGSGYNAVLDFGYWNTFDASIYTMGYYGSAGGVFKITDNGAGPVYDRMIMSGATLAFPSSSVGIGTTNPRGTLDITGSGNTVVIGDGGTGGSLYFGAASNANSILYAGGEFQIRTNQSSGINFYTQGTQKRVIIADDGNVGIATTSAGYKLDVGGPTRIQGNTTNGVLLLNGGDSSGTFVRATVAFAFNPTDGYYHWLHTRHNAGTSAGNAIDFYTSDGTQNGTFPTNGVHGMTITAGNVGIGTTGPSTAKLVITTAATAEGIDLSTADSYANLRVMRNSLSSIDKDMYIGYQSGAGSRLHLYSNDIETITVSGGNVGIGTTNPASSKLQLIAAGSGFTQERTSGGFFYASGFNSTNAYLTYYTAANFIIGYGTSTGAAPTVTTLALTTAGNVGIGLTTPTINMHVSQSANTSVGFRAENPNTGLDAFSVLQLGSNIAANQFANLSYASTGVAINGAFYPTGSTLAQYGNGGLNFLAAGTASPIRFFTGTGTGTLKMIVENGGNVGVGTSTPQGLFHVQGRTVISGSLNLSGSAVGIPEHMILALSDETTNITTGTAKVTFRAPFAMKLIQTPRASLSTVSTSGLVTVDINEAGTSIFTTRITIDANELTSVTAATPAVLSDFLIADDAQITMDIDTAGTGARGLKVTLYYIRI